MTSSAALCVILTTLWETGRVLKEGYEDTWGNGKCNIDVLQTLIWIMIQLGHTSLWAFVLSRVCCWPGKCTALPPGHFDVLATLWLCLVSSRVMEEVLYGNASASRCLTREHSALLILGCCQQDRFSILSYKDVNCRSGVFYPYESAVERTSE